ncbi:unnamed protein product [Trichogramma brassicae]|uniref:Reverse transcriptase domain-containing protein n=1 Tax=Trichogramma brassicae TaxID=86971 RepID=A0A6H5IUV0_9HYME|nr:unnamed protein product [Trichogramma brassicae]
MKNRLQWWAEVNDWIPKDQHGFRRGHSGVDNMTGLFLMVENAFRGSRDVLTTFLDVEGAFDNVNVDVLLERLASLGCTRRIVKFVQFVTRERLIFTEGATTAMRLCKGVPQGAVLSPLLLRTTFRSAWEAADPAEGVAALESAIETLGENLDSIGLGISPLKTKLIRFNDRNIQPGRQRIKIREHVVSSCSHTKFLGVIFDYRLSFKEHINYIKKMHLNNEYHEIFVWHILGITPGHSRSTIDAIRIVVETARSAIAACVLAGVLPLDLEADERARLYEIGKREGVLLDRNRTMERMRSLDDWQRRWTGSNKGRWTVKLIPDLKPWVQRKHGEMNYYLTQLLSGHGCFRAYLCRFGHDDLATCPSCPTEDEDAEHVLFRCPRFARERESLWNAAGQPLTSETVVAYMLSSHLGWAAVSSFASTVMKQLRIGERTRHAG